MKNIYVATDSRGTVATAAGGSRDTSWTERFMKAYPATFIPRRSAMEIPTHHIYDILGIESVPDKHYDLAVLQTGMYTGIDYCSEGVFKGLFGPHYKAESLTYHHPDVNRYIYINREDEKRIFALLQQKCKRVVYIGLHILTRWHLELRKGREWNPTYNELAKVQNEWYSSLVTDYIPLPWDEAWVDQCTPVDEYLHYTEPGVQYILGKLEPIMQEVLAS